MEDLNKFFHELADEGKEINNYRVFHQEIAHRHKQISKLPARKIEFAIKVEKLKQDYHKSKK
jgi:hypothetical protein